MITGVILYFIVSSFASLTLLSSPYLRITSLGWLIAIWTLPYIGALAFIFTVVRAKKKPEDDAMCRLLDRHQDDTCHHGVIEHVGMSYDFLPYFPMDDYTLLRDDAFVPAVISAIESAQHRVWICTYIFSGGVKARVMTALEKAHERGVDVRLLVDRVGSGLLFRSRGKPLGEDVPYAVSGFHAAPWRSFVFLEKRLHSKIVLADAQAIIGAHNLRDEVELSHDESVHNVSMAFSGGVVSQLEAVFIDVWKLNTGVALAALCEDGGWEDAHEHDERHEHGDNAENTFPARIIYSDPLSLNHNYSDYLSDVFAAAKMRICIWMPYVVPSYAMRRTLIAAAKRGLDIRVLFPKISDSFLVDNAHALVIKELHDGGVNCAQSEGRFDHSKIIIIDDVCLIGSTNLDYRSLYRNYEANVEVNSPRFTRDIFALFNEAFDAADHIDCYQVGRLANIRNQFTSLIAGLY